VNYVYVLTEADLALIERLTIAMRAFANRPSANYLGDPDDSERGGFAGEIAMARLWDLPYNEERRVNGQGDGGFDYLISARGWSFAIDVKTRTGKYTDLLVKKSVIDAGNVADFYVCAHFNGDRTVTLIGWQTLRHVMHSPLKSFNNGPVNYICERRYLHPMAMLDGVIRRRDGVVQCP